MRSWKIESAQWRTQLNVSPSYKPWTSLDTFKGAGVPRTGRVLDFLDMVCADKIKNLRSPTPQNIKVALTGVYADYSQSHGRRNFTSNANMSRCLCTSSSLYSYDRDTMILPLEMLMWHGHPKDVKIPPKMTQGQLKIMAGSGMALQSLSTVIWGIHLLKQFP
jgi:hypothetical protein